MQSRRKDKSLDKGFNAAVVGRDGWHVLEAGEQESRGRCGIRILLRDNFGVLTGSGSRYSVCLLCGLGGCFGIVVGCWMDGRIGDGDIVVGLFSRQQIPSAAKSSSTYVRELCLGPDKLVQLAHEHAVLVLLYPALPVGASSRDEHLLCICCHGAIEILFAFNVQSRRSLATLAGGRRAFFQGGKGRFGKGYGDAGSRCAAVLHVP